MRCSGRAASVCIVPMARPIRSRRCSACITGETVFTAFKGLQTGLAAKLAGVSATFSNADHRRAVGSMRLGCEGRRHASSTASPTAECSLTRAVRPRQSFGVDHSHLVSRRASSASDFALPVGATVVTELIEQLPADPRSC